MSRQSLVDFAQSRALDAFPSKPRAVRRDLGQYPTPTVIAQEMAARLVSGFDSDEAVILDPAAGTGILAAALLDALIERGVGKIVLYAFEIDLELVVHLRALVARARKRCEGVVDLSVKVVTSDFLESRLDVGFDFVIANPPYFKIRKTDERAADWLHALTGQPNIYDLFMLKSASYLKKEGRWCFLTPRTWLNGSYSVALRAELIRHLKFDGFHFITNRSNLFGRKGLVKQDLVLTWAAKIASADYRVAISSSESGDTMGASQLKFVSLAQVFSDAPPQIEVLDSDCPFKCRLSDFGLNVKTGPVVPFRAQSRLRQHGTSGAVPLIWMRHVKRGQLTWPSSSPKNEMLMPDERSASLLSRDDGVLLVRRFSPSDESMRVVCAPVFAGSFDDGFFSVENHLNMICCDSGIADDFLIGLSSFLSSRFVEDQVRKLCGSSQVNASDLRQLRFPHKERIEALGRYVLRDANAAQAVEVLVEDFFGSDSVAVRSINP